MKKSFIVLTAALAFGMAAAQDTTAPATATPATTPAATPAATPTATQVPTLTDVPAGHWAKDAIDRLVQRGIILGYPDGTYRGTQNLTRYEAAVIIARLLDQIRTDGVPSGLSGDDLTALQNAIQELAADLTALGVRVSDLEENAVNRDDFSRLEARVEELAAANGDANAIAGLQAQIAELTARADEFDALRADVDDNASSIAALNDLTVLLNQDILNLQDRVSAVESAQADFVQRSDFDNLAGRVGTIDTRVTTLENAPRFSVGGTISATYGNLLLTNGTRQFDVDRLIRQTGVDLGDADVTTTDTDDVYTAGEVSFGVRASNLTTANGAIVINSAALNFGVNNILSFDDDTTVRLNDASATGAINGQAFTVNYDADDSRFFFNDYLFNNNDDDGSAVNRTGFVATIGATQLPGRPTITTVIGNAQGNGDATPPLSGNYYGVRFQVQPTSDAASTFGISFAQNNGNRSALGLDLNARLFGVSLRSAYVASVVQTPGSFVTAGGSFQNAINNRDQAFFVDGTADLGIAKIGANFRAIAPNFGNGVAGMSADQSENAGVVTPVSTLATPFGNAPSLSSSYGLPYEANQVGFGVGAGTTLGPLNLGAFVDSRTVYYRTDPAFAQRLNFGVSAGASLGALSLTGFYNQSRVGNTVVHADVQTDSRDGNQYFKYNSTTPYQGVANVPFAFSSTVGGVLRHDGAASNAIVPGLSFTVADAYFYDDRVNDFQAYANYAGNLGGVQIQPFARYHLLTTPGNGTVTDTGQVSPVTGAALTGAAAPQVTTYNTVKYGVRVSTQPLDIVLRPSLSLNFANRITNTGRGVTVGGATTTELFGQAALTFNDFIAANTKATLGYAYYQGFNVAASCGAGVVNGNSSSATTATYSAASDRIYCSPFSAATSPYGGDNLGTVDGSTQGIFANVTWNGLGLNYGIFRNTDFNVPAGAAGRTSVGQGFKVSYTVKF